MEWRWVPIKHKPRDNVTRSMHKKFDGKVWWFTGTVFLYQPISDCPVKGILIPGRKEKVHLCHDETHRTAESTKPW